MGPCIAARSCGTIWSMPTTTFDAYADAVRAEDLTIATEHSFRPALKGFIETLGGIGVTATNEPRRSDFGAPDFDVSRQEAAGRLSIGHVETKDLNSDLDHVEESEQLRRYRAALPNLVLTDYLTFRWYLNGEFQGGARWATLQHGRLLPVRGGAEAIEAMLTRFLGQQPPRIADARLLSERMAAFAHLIRDLTVTAFAKGRASSMLADLRRAFEQVLLPDLTIETFADMFAQTLTYGLFAARVNHAGGRFTRTDATHEIPQTNPFLRHLFGVLAGPQLDAEPFAGLVDDLAQMLDRADIDAILADFGRRRPREDPVVHFYETFLNSYDPQLREARGVYFTPEPVVSYIVRSVDHLLRTRFGCTQGLANAAVAEYAAEQGSVPKQGPRVTILDPAVGTGTFLYAVTDLIREGFRETRNAGMWPGYVHQHLLPRIFGFELLMAPYAVAHLKLGMQLRGLDLPENERADWAYHFDGSERLRVFLTNSLEEAVARPELLMGQFISDEANAATDIKRELPIMVVLGNPPYSNFGQMNRGPWIRGLLEDYKRDLGERKLNLDDDFIKFIRFGQWRIDKTGTGILAYVSNNSYIDGITHRQMRRFLRESFTDIYILNLHGNTRKGEHPPSGGLDQNVFDIMQGVAIGIFVKDDAAGDRPARIHQADLWGSREDKYQVLLNGSVETTAWTDIEPDDEFVFFVPRTSTVGPEYRGYVGIDDLMPENGSGFTSQRDSLVLGFTRDEVIAKMQEYLDLSVSDDDTRSRFGIHDYRAYDVATDRRTRTFDASKIRRCLYRPFDERWIYFDRPIVQEWQFRYERHMLEPNICLVTTRQTKDPFGALSSRLIVGHKAVAAYDRNNIFPLYLYPEQAALFGSTSGGSASHRDLNFDRDLLYRFEQGVGLRFSQQQEMGDLKKDFGPFDFLCYIYAILYSPTYRSRYEENLAFDFPRIPFTSQPDVFVELVKKGRQLVELHSPDSDVAGQERSPYPIPGDNVIRPTYPKFLPPGTIAPNEEDPLSEGRVYINGDAARRGHRAQYFGNISEAVWEMPLGGYFPAQRWLADRRRRVLTQDDLTHYGRSVVVQRETLRIMEEIDAAIPGWPLT